MQINLSDVYITLVNSNRNFSITKLLTLGEVVMNKFDNIVDGIDFTDCVEAMKRAFREKLRSEIQRRRDDSKKLNIDVQLHMTIEKK